MRDRDKQKAIIWLRETAAIWEKELVGRTFLVVYGQEPYSYFEVSVDRSNFMHLAGIYARKPLLKHGGGAKKAKDPMGATRFFELARDGQLTIGDFDFSHDSYLEEKLDVLHKAQEIFKRKQLAGAFRKGSRAYVVGNFAMGNTTSSFVLGNAEKNNKKIQYLMSCMSEKIDELADPISNIRAIYWKWKSERGPYDKSRRYIAFQGLDETLLDPTKVR